MTTFTALRRSAQAERIALTDTLVRVLAVAFVAAVVAGMDGLTTLGAIPGRLVEALDLSGPAPRPDVALWLAGTYVAGAAGALILAFIATRRDRIPDGDYDPALARSYMRFAAPLAITAVAGVLANRMDAVMIGYFWSAGQVGFYYMAQRFAAVVTMIPIAVGTVFFPLISELARQHSNEGVREVAASAQRLLLVAVLPVVLTFALLREPLLHILVGDAYKPAGTILALLSLQALLMALTVVATSVVKGFDQPRLAATSGLLIMGSNTVLNVLLIPDSILGVPLVGGKAVGAAVATVVAQGIGMVYIHVRTRALVGRSILGLFAVRQLAAAGAVGVLGWYALPHWPGGIERIWDMVAANALILAAYLLALMALREWTRRDWVFFLDLIDPRKMVRYIRDDIGGSR